MAQYPDQLLMLRRICWHFVPAVFLVQIEAELKPLTEAHCHTGSGRWPSGGTLRVTETF